MSSVQEESSVDEIRCFKISNSKGYELRCISLGATITGLKLPDGTDVVLGFKDLRDYRTNPSYIGVSVGRVANRIRDAAFSLDDTNYKVSSNIPPHTLHGGEVGFGKANWEVVSARDSSVVFRHVSPAGDMGYPGTLTATATYSLAESGEVTVEYTATTDSPTIVNLVNHAYFNLAQKGTIFDHVLTINATRYLPLDEELIAIGTLDPVAGTPYDFTTPTPIGQRISQVDQCYDRNFIVGESKDFHPTQNDLKLCATLQEPTKGHELKVYSDQPGMQLYTGHFLDTSYVGKDGNPILQSGGVCLETQAWPNAINLPEAKDQMILRPGQTYRSKTVWVLKPHSSVMHD